MFHFLSKSCGSYTKYQMKSQTGNQNSPVLRIHYAICVIIKTSGPLKKSSTPTVMFIGKQH